VLPPTVHFTPAFFPVRESICGHFSATVATRSLLSKPFVPHGQHAATNTVMIARNKAILRPGSKCTAWEDKPLNQSSEEIYQSALNQ
jgi:hypothetical protein